MERLSGSSLRAPDGERSSSQSPRLTGRTSSPALVIDLSVPSGPDVVDLTQESPELPRKRRRPQSRCTFGLGNQLYQSDHLRRRKPRQKRLLTDFREERKRSLLAWDESPPLDFPEECSSPSPELPERLDLPTSRCDRAFLARANMDDGLEIISSTATALPVNRCWTTQGASSSTAINIADDNSPNSSESPRRVAKNSPPPLLSGTVQSGLASRVANFRPCKRRSHKRSCLRSPAASSTFGGTATSLMARSSLSFPPPSSHLVHNNCANVDEAADELLARALQRIYEEEDSLPTYTPLPLVGSSPLGLALSRYTDVDTHTTQTLTNSIAPWPYEALLTISDRLGPGRKLGMTQTAIRALPTVHYQPSDNSQRQDTCVICLSDFQVGDQLRQLPCAHRFHRKCVDNWLSKNKACPICRSSAAACRTSNDSTDI